MENISILIVENLRLIAMDIRNICRELGYSCRLINYDSDTIKKIEEVKPDLILMDIEIPDDKDMIDEAERICDEFKIPIIFFTTAPVSSLSAGRPKNRCLFHPIPFKSKELIEAIELLLNGYRLNLQ